MTLWRPPVSHLVATCNSREKWLIYFWHAISYVLGIFNLAASQRRCSLWELSQGCLIVCWEKRPNRQAHSHNSSLHLAPHRQTIDFFPNNNCRLVAANEPGSVLPATVRLTWPWRAINDVIALRSRHLRRLIFFTTQHCDISVVK